MSITYKGMSFLSMSQSCLICCPECKASLLAEHGVGCAWYAERVLECIADAIADEPNHRSAAQRAGAQLPPDEMAN